MMYDKRNATTTTTTSCQVSKDFNLMLIFTLNMQITRGVYTAPEPEWTLP